MNGGDLKSRILKLRMSLGVLRG
uniref:Uncharacterized protein n=1 Tax=Rhizophora mucronata TaxID=61149 RepID=A0A2P2R343_RHIMU